MRRDIIKSKIKEKGISRPELSQTTGIPLDTLNKIISGAIKNPPYSTIESIAHVLGCSTDEFSDSWNLEEAQIENMTDEEVEAAIQETAEKAAELFNSLSPEMQGYALEFLALLQKVATSSK